MDKIDVLDEEEEVNVFKIEVQKRKNLDNQKMREHEVNKYL